MQKSKVAIIKRITAIVAARNEGKDSAFAVQLNAESEAHVLTRQLYRQLEGTTKPQAELHAAITALMAVKAKAPITIVCNSPVLARLLERDEQGQFVHEIKANPQLSQRLRALASVCQELRVELDKDQVKPVLKLIGDKLECDSGTMVELIASCTRS